MVDSDFMDEVKNPVTLDVTVFLGIFIHMYVLGIK